MTFFPGMFTFNAAFSLGGAPFGSSLVEDAWVTDGDDPMVTDGDDPFVFLIPSVD